MAATRLLWICHAATVATRRSAFPRGGEEIEEGAAAQCRALAALIEGAARVWTSPAAAAQQTAQALGLSAVVDPLLRDLDYGDWAGRELKKIAAAEPDAVAAWTRDPAMPPPGGESLLDLIARVGGWLDRQRQDQGRVTVVTHPAVIRAAVVRAIEAAPQSFWHIDVPPLSRTVLSASQTGWRLCTLEPLRPATGAA